MNTNDRREAATTGRFNYAGPYTTEHAAWVSLHESYADGEISPAEKPAIVQQKGKFYVEING